MLQSQLRPLSSGEILDSAFGIYRRHFVTLLVTALIPLAPLAVVTALIARGVVAAGGTAEEAGTATIPATLVGMVVLLVMWGALTRQVEQACTGGPVTVADGYRNGFRAFFPLLGVTLLMYLLLALVFVGVGIVAVFVLGIVVGIAAAAGASADAGGVVVAAIVGVVMVVVGFAAALLVSASLFAVYPTVVVESAGPVQAIRRSIALARGARLRVAGVVAVALMIVFLPSIGVTFLTGGFAGMLDPGHTPTTGAIVAQQVASTVVGALTTPFLVGTLVLLYFDRRVRNEALDVRLAADALPAL